MAGKMKPLAPRTLRDFEVAVIGRVRSAEHKRDVYRILERSSLRESGCIEFDGPDNGNGYRVIWSSRLRKPRYAHRLVCEAVHGEMGDLMTLHSCDNRTCVNPDHLRPGTALENVADAIARNRIGPPRQRDWATYLRNHRHHWQRLDIADIPVIRERLSRGDRVCDIARDYGVAGQTIGNIKAGTRWRHVA